MSTPANVFLGTGRRKTATARVRVTEGSGKLVVNGRTLDAYFSHENFAKQAYAPLLTVSLKDKIKRDPREKERKKAGQPGARKRFQFSKR
jgi:small subunit ribosomal protein S9